MLPAYPVDAATSRTVLTFTVAVLAEVRNAIVQQES
jgi:hypothetical protein